MGDGFQDGDIARRFLEHEPLALSTVRGLVSRIVARKGRFSIPRSQHEDIVQDVMLSLIGSLPRTELRFERGFEAFVRHVTHARCVDFWRNGRPEREIEGDIPDRSRPSPEACLVDEERMRTFRTVLRALGDGCRRLIRLHVVESLTYAEIADRLGRSERALRVQMCHCLTEARKIRRQLEARPA